LINPADKRVGPTIAYCGQNQHPAGRIDVLLPGCFFRRLVSMNCLIERNEVFPVLSFVERLSIGD